MEKGDTSKASSPEGGAKKMEGLSKDLQYHCGEVGFILQQMNQLFKEQKVEAHDSVTVLEINKKRVEKLRAQVATKRKAAEGEAEMTVDSTV